MKQNDIKELPRLSKENFENVFNVYQNDKSMYYYNLLQTVSFPQNLPASLFTAYDIKYGDTWPNISFKTLQSPNIWWIILLANNIQNPLEPLVPGTTIKIPIIEVVKQVLNSL